MWGNFEASSNDEETISNAFSSRGIFKIGSDEVVNRYPEVQAILQNGKTVIAIDRSIVLLQDENFSTCSFLNFNSTIDVIATSNSGNLILCGLSDGEIHGISIEGNHLFNLSAQSYDVHLTGKTFTNIQLLRKQFHFCCTNGNVYVLSEIYESVLENDVLQFEYDKNNVEDPMDEPTIRRITTGRSLNDVTTAILIPKYPEGEIIIAATYQSLYFKSSAEDLIRIDIPELFGAVKKIFNLEHYIVILTHSGHLLELCPFTKMFFQRSAQSNILIDDMIIMECSDENIELLVLTKAIQGEERAMKIIQYPSFASLSELDVSEHAWLVQQPKCSVNLYHLEGTSVNNQNFPTFIEMVLISETHPSDRFKKLIAKGQLEQAEDFGKQFELCLQPVYEAKAKRLLITWDYLSNKNPEDLEQRFLDLFGLLQKIQNKNFFRNNRIINFPNRKMLERYLKEILKHLNEEDDDRHILDITEQLHRIDTLTIIDPYECDMKWQTFVFNENLVEVVKTLFKTDFLHACLIWKRHASAIIPRINEFCIRKLLSFIPNDTDAFNLIQWLRQFVPSISGTHPNLLSFITDWSIQKTRGLQYSNLWPEIGLEFSTKVLEIFKELNFLHSDVRRQHERNITKLQEIVDALQDLSVLKESYNLILTLDNYLQDSIDKTAYCILQRVHLEKLRSLVNDFLYPIFQEKGKIPVGSIQQYIIKLISNRKCLSTWLDRAVACIELLHNEDDRLECALLVLQNSPVPWPDVVAPLVKLRFSTHPLARKISTEYEFQAIKIMKAKYDWPVDTPANYKINLFMQRIVYRNLPEMLDDIRILTRAAPEIATNANFTCCHHLIKSGSIEEAYEFFKSIKNKQQTENLISTLADMLENSISPLTDQHIEEQKQLIEFYKLVIPYAETPTIVQKSLQSVQNRFILRNKFRLTVNCISDLVSHKNRLNFLDLGIENIIVRGQATLHIVQFITSELKELSKALELQYVYAIHRATQKLQCLSLTCALAYNVLQAIDCTEENSEHYIELAMELIAQQIFLCRSKEKKIIFTSISNDNNSLAFPLAYELLVNASLHTQDNKIDLIDFLKYIHLAMRAFPVNTIERYYFGREQEINQQIIKILEATDVIPSEKTQNENNSLNDHQSIESKKDGQRYSFSEFDVIDVQKMQQPQKEIRNLSTGYLHIVKFVSCSLHLMVIDTRPTNTLLRKLSTLLNEKLDKDVERVQEDFIISSENLLKLQIFDIWYIMAQYLLDYQQKNGEQCNILSKNFVSSQLLRVLRHRISQTDINFIELFVMLIADDEALTILKKLERLKKSDLQKLNFLTLSEMYYVHIGDVKKVEEIRNKRIKYYYFLEFCKQDPTIRNKFNPDDDSINHLLNLLSDKQLDVQLLERMSNDFNLDYQKILVTQILSILSTQEPQYDIKTNSFGDEELVMLTTVEDIRKLCQPYMNAIKNNDLLITKLKCFLDFINVYFYELYLCVIEILSYFDAVPKEMQIWSNILQFLKHKMTTRRRSRPGQLEIDICMQSQKGMGILPKIARYRLPFKPIVENPLKDILDDELSVDNCESWFPLIQMHTILKESSKDINSMRDYFCMSVVKNVITEYKIRNDPDVWHLQPTNNAFFQSVLRLVKHVTSPSKAFMILYVVSSYAPDGADQVEASYECYKYAIKNESVITEEKYQEHIAKIKRKYFTLKTQHLLHIYDLSDEKLMRLVDNPTKLIQNLYYHALVLKPTKMDINGVVKEIAELHNLNLQEIQLTLLQKWLSFSATDTANGTMTNNVLEDTFYDDDQHALDHTNANLDNGNPTENVIRANYILSSWPKQKAVPFLVGQIFPLKASINTTRQLQIYECFSQLNDGSSLFINAPSQEEYITIKCVHDLKNLGYKVSLDKFAECNKFEIIKKIWQNNAQNPQSLVVIANICLGFNIFLSKIWNGVLKRMAKYNMIKELNALVDVLSCKMELLYTEGLVAAWECVLKHPFKNANQTRSIKQEDVLNKTLFRLQNCPVAHKLNLFEFAELCIVLARPHMAAVLLAFRRNDYERQKIKELILRHKTEKLRKEILELEDAGLLPVVLNFALKELDL